MLNPMFRRIAGRFQRQPADVARWQEMERQSAQGKASSSDADELKEELRRLQKQPHCCA